MFGFKKKATKSDKSNDKTTEPGFFSRIKKGLSRTRSQFTSGITSFLPENGKIGDDVIEELETLLLMSDAGIDATQQIIEQLQTRLDKKQLNDSKALFEALSEDMLSLIQGVELPLSIDTTQKPFVILMVGINGVGKTTTIGKLAKFYQDQGHKIMLAAGDTFRAAAVEQLETWGERNDVPVISQHRGADPAAVIYDALSAAKARDIDILIADTAGRLHTQSNLMEELKKIKRVIQKIDASAPHEIMLVLDAGTGQNALNQAKEFDQAVGLSGITLTKLDGTAKGGIVFALAKQLGVPIRFIGIGERAEDLRPFEAKPFVAALLDREES
ncbi:MAG: signal recognition particle-docking protein FtsY [Gammaproteobacteria bacterium]|nr:signal recognition particle-docking protein FtsY [Gammaproteobacteria bacterium]MDH5691618.1 signal recognition particle-docking protein FtsY [Gammaproteobacteria bacterium]